MKLAMKKEDLFDIENLPPAKVFKFQDLPVTEFREGVYLRYVEANTIIMTRITMKKGAFSPLHRHANEQIVMLIEGRVRTRSGECGSEVYVEMNPGDFFRVPAGALHQVEALDDSVFAEAFGPAAFLPSPKSTD